MWALGSPVSLLWVFSLLDLAIVAFGQNGQRLFLKPNDTIYTKMDEEVAITCSSFDFPAKNLGQIQNYSIGANTSSITECLWTRNVQWENGNYSEEFHCAVEYLLKYFFVFLGIFEGNTIFDKLNAFESNFLISSENLRNICQNRFLKKDHLSMEGSSGRQREKSFINHQYS